MVPSLVPVLGGPRGPTAPSLAPRDTGSREALPRGTVSCLGALQAGVDPLQVVYVSIEERKSIEKKYQFNIPFSCYCHKFLISAPFHFYFFLTGHFNVKKIFTSSFIIQRGPEKMQLL